MGIVEYEDFVQLSIADLPGLLPDITKGFGSKYLYHLERCKTILYVIDISQENFYEQFIDIKNLLYNFEKNLIISKKAIIIANKIDLCEERDTGILKEKLEILRQKSNEIVVPVSSLNKINLKKFLKLFRDFNETNLNKN